MTRRSFFTKEILALFLILVLAILLRLFRLSDLATFNYDEARDATIEYQLLHGHLTLLGPDSKIGNHTIYFGPLHYYLMAPALAVAQFNPLGPYVWTGLLGVLTTFLIYVLTRSKLVALFYAIVPLAVIYNRWAWNPNTIPLFSALYLIFLTRKKYFLAGIFLGLTIQLHFTAAFLILLPFIFKIFRRPYHLAVLFLGLTIGLSPLIFFDLRHNFLYLQSLVSLFGTNLSSSRSFSWHYLLWSLPILAWGIKLLPPKVSLVVILLSLTSSLTWLWSQKPNGAQNPRTIKTIASLIAADTKSDPLPFNVASFVDPDARATAYRYFLLLEGVVPAGVGEYGVVDHLYVVTFEEPTKVLYNKTYEIAAFRPKRVSRTWKHLGENIYRLERT